MTDINLLTMPREKAIQLVMKDFRMDRLGAEEFVTLARGEKLDDVTTKAKKAKLGAGSRFAALQAKMGKKNDADADDMKTGKAYGGLGNTTFGGGNKKTGNLGLTRNSNSQGGKKTGSLGLTRFGAGNQKTGSLGNLKTGSGSKKTGSLGRTQISTIGGVFGSINQPKANGKGTSFFPAGRKINLLLGKKGHDPKA